MRSVIIIDKPSDCCGCEACRNGCPVNAITMQADKEGFLYPQVDTARCVGCGKCERICPVKNKAASVTERTTTAYAARVRNGAVRQASSSGGVFTAIATHVLENGGIVFGAAFDEHFCVRHIGIDRVEDLEKLRGSKYVQSEIGTSYAEAKRHLDEGRSVLFTGTPCQISGLYRYLGKTYDTLLTQDIVCHGVPSPSVWDAYVRSRETKAASETRFVSFRHKQYGWRDYAVRFEFVNGKTDCKRSQYDPYMRSYLRNLSIRPSCFDCTFKSPYREADITLADFWGVEHVCKEMDDDQGTSLVLLHSDKARAIYREIDAALDSRAVEVDAAAPYNPSMTTSTKPNPNRAAFFERMGASGFDGIRPFIRDPWIRRVKRAIKTLLSHRSLKK